MTDPAFHRQVSELFLELRRLPREEQAEAVSAAAAGNDRLRAELEELLAHDVTAAGDDATVDSLDLENAPSQIGPYRILRCIGHGGSGRVFLAEQDEPIRRRVAVKVVPQAAVNPEMAARFEVERRSLESADHPNVARVLDAGRTPDGLPYLVMDYIEGEAITTYCDSHRTPIPERIRLMLDVADAVQHLHRLGVIHRDLKPANILVMEVDGRPSPRVLDFGIAKAVAGSFAGESPPTSGLPMGTPSYMAPEQTGLRPVDTRADIYALGAVLYELVCGKPPIDAAGDPLEVMRRIREEAPPSASRVLSRNASSRTGSRVSPSFLTDLDCILEKSLEKSPERRYSTVGEWADDLQRLLQCEPILARRPTLRYRAVRFGQRNRALVASALVVVTALALGFAGLALGFVEANHQRREAMMQNEVTEAINRFLTEDLLAATSPDDQGTDVTALDLLQRASRRVDARLEDRPRIAASIHYTLGNAYAELGAFDDADRHLGRAAELHRAVGSADSPDTVRTDLALGSLRVRQQRFDDAEPILLAGMHRARLVLGPDDSALYTALNDLGVLYLSRGQHEDAQRALVEALAGRTLLYGTSHRDVLVTTGNLAYVYGEQGNTKRSLQMMKEMLQIAESLPDVPRLTLLTIYNNIGATYQGLRENEVAAPYLRQAAELADAHLGPDHPATLSIQGNLAGLEVDLGQTDRAAEIFREIVEKRTAQLGADTADTLIARYGYWNALRRGGRSAEAAAGFEELLVDVARALGEEHWLTAQSMSALASSLIDDGRHGEALPHAEIATERLLRIYGPDHARAQSAVTVLEAARAGAAPHSQPTQE